MPEVNLSRDKVTTTLVVDSVDLTGVELFEPVYIKFLGRARRRENGKFEVLANYCSALCWIEVTLTFPKLETLG